MTIITVEISSFKTCSEDIEVYEVSSQRMNFELGNNETTHYCGEYIIASEKATKVIRHLEEIFSNPGHLGMVPMVEIVAVNGNEVYYCPL